MLGWDDHDRLGPGKLGCGLPVKIEMSREFLIWNLDRKLVRWRCQNGEQVFLSQTISTVGTGTAQSVV
jgi:hypothetical protein